MTPNLFIAGMTRSGTTSLFRYLGDHPAICPSSVKETRYLLDKEVSQNKAANYNAHGWERYGRYFQHCGDEQYRLEATPTYVFQETALNIIPRIEPHPVVIFMLRKPTDRIYSAFRFRKYRQGKTNASLSRFLEEEQWLIRTSHYEQLLAPWFEKMLDAHLLVYLFEYLKEQPRFFMQQVARDLQIDANFYQNYQFQPTNRGAPMKHHWIYQFGKKVTPLIPHWVKHHLLLPLNRRWNTTTAPSPTPEEKQILQQLEQRFESLYQLLANKYDLDLSYWE